MDPLLPYKVKNLLGFGLALVISIDTIRNLFPFLRRKDSRGYSAVIIMIALGFALLTGVEFLIHLSSIMGLILQWM